MKGRLIVSTLGLLAMLLSLINPLTPAFTPQLALAEHTPDPASVTIAGSLQSELGCPGDWDPSCEATFLLYDEADAVWQGSFSLPAGEWEYKAALNGSWDENYGANATRDGANIPLSWRKPLRSSSTTTTPRTGSPTTRIRSSQPYRAASNPSWAARGIGSRTACAPGCKTRTATGCMPSRPAPYRPATTKQSRHR
jgi:hypothetical protein